MLSKMVVNTNHGGLPYISVVVPCYNARRTISETLDAICSQDADFPFEIIVVDSSNDGTDEIVRKNYHQVHLIHLDRQTLPGSGRNLGVSHARGEIVVFTDSDCMPDPDWLSRIASVYQNQTTDSVGGCVINGYPRNMIAWVSHLIEFNEWTPSTQAGYVRNIPSCNISFRREVFSKFRINYTDIFPSEDTLFNWSLIQQGGRIYFDPRIRVVHLSRAGFGKLFKHQVRLGKASAEARRTSTLPGGIFIRFPVLCIGLPLIRWFRASLRLLKKEPGTLLLFLAITPLYIPATIAWTIGFLSRGNFSKPRYVVRNIRQTEEK